MSTLNLLKKKFPQFVWEKNDSGCFSGFLNDGIKTVKICKDLHKLSFVHIFISGHMYPGTNKDFVYAMCYQQDTVKPYRCRNTYENEFGKVYVSAKKLDKIVSKLVKQVDLSVYHLNTVK